MTVNYRLGPLGFLTLENDLAPGNLGLHDQVLALNWVQQHIASFGGDQSNITLMGESAGGMSCFLHLVSPLSRGLFQRVSKLELQLMWDSQDLVSKESHSLSQCVVVMLKLSF